VRIPCPHCGERGSEEFAYFGDAVSRPKENGPDPAGAWMDYVYRRDNPAGPHRELWHHVHGCRGWLVVARNTRDHMITEAEPATAIATKSGGKR